MLYHTNSRVSGGYTAARFYLGLLECVHTHTPDPVPALGDCRGVPATPTGLLDRPRGQRGLRALPRATPIAPTSQAKGSGNF